MRDGDEEEKKGAAKGDKDGIPDQKVHISSKVSLHSDKKVTEPLLSNGVGDDDGANVNFLSSQNSFHSHDDITKKAKDMKKSGSGYKAPNLNLS